MSDYNLISISKMEMKKKREGRREEKRGARLRFLINTCEVEEGRTVIVCMHVITCFGENHFTAAPRLILNVNIRSL